MYIWVLFRINENASRVKDAVSRDCWVVALELKALCIYRPCHCSRIAYWDALSLQKRRAEESQLSNSQHSEIKKMFHGFQIYLLCFLFDLLILLK